jgi:hypothetical protein
VWVADVVPGRFRPGFTPKLYIDNAGSDANDGLVSNAAGNPLLTVQGCLSILASEYDLKNIQAVCAPTAGQTALGSFQQIGMAGGTSVIWIDGNGGAANLRVTPGANTVATMSDFGGYLIFRNVQLDCTGGAATCYGLFIHQQNGVDFFTGTSFSGAHANDQAVFCDSFCKVNMNGDASAAFTLNGTMGNAFVGNLNSSFVFSTGIHIAAGTTIFGNMVDMSGSSNMAMTGALTLDAVNAVGTFFSVHANSTVCLVSFSVVGATAAGAQKFRVFNGGLLQNASANVIPGTVAGTVGTGAGGLGVGYAPDGAGGNTGVNGAGC